MRFDIKISAAAAIALTGYLLPGAALANLSCPGGTVEMNGQCVVVNNGTTPPGTTNTATGGAGGNSSSDATAGAVGVGTGIGVGTGGNATTGPVNVTTGPTTATGGQGGQGGAGGSIGDTTATSGSTSTATGGSSVAGVTGSGNSSSSSTSGVSGSGNSTNSTTVNNTNKTRIKHAASTAAPALIQNTGNTLCDGGGSFSASVQTFGWGISAANKKGDRFCQLLATFGPQVAGAYIAEKDNAAKRAMLNNGAAITSRQAASPDARAVVRCPASHPNLRDVRGELRCYR